MMRKPYYYYRPRRNRQRHPPLKLLLLFLTIVLVFIAFAPSTAEAKSSKSSSQDEDSEEEDDSEEEEEEEEEGGGGGGGGGQVGCLVLGILGNLAFCQKTLWALNAFLDLVVVTDAVPELESFETLRVNDIEFDGCVVTAELELKGDLTDGGMLTFPFDGTIEFTFELEQPLLNLLTEQQICLTNLEVTNVDSGNEVIDPIIVSTVNGLLPDGQCLGLTNNDN